VHAVGRAEWESRLRPGGEPTKLPSPLTPFSSVPQRAEVETYAMSARPAVALGGFHVVRRDDVDAPNIFNTDSYVEIDLTSHQEWDQILKMARLTDWPELASAISGHVFLTGPERRPDHHSPHVPGDIDDAKAK